MARPSSRCEPPKTASDKRHTHTDANDEGGQRSGTRTLAVRGGRCRRSKVGGEVADAKRGVAIQHLGVVALARPGAREDLPGRPAVGHEVMSQALIKPLQRAEITRSYRSLHLRVEGGGPLVQIAGCLQRPAGAAVPPDQERAPGSGLA